MYGKKNNSFGLKNVNVVHDDCVKLLLGSVVFPDVIFFDPPWGGVNYDKTKPMELYLSSKSMSSIINDIRYKNKPYKLLFMKVPKNYDVVNLKRQVKCHTIWVKNYRKYMIIFLLPVI